jgi:hypothetical protein
MEESSCAPLLPAVLLVHGNTKVNRFSVAGNPHVRTRAFSPAI